MPCSERYKVVAAVTSAAFDTFPVVVPNAVAPLPVPRYFRAAVVLRGTGLANVELLLTRRCPVRCASPADFRKAPGLRRVASPYRFGTFLVVFVLTRAHVTFQGKTC